MVAPWLSVVGLLMPLSLSRFFALWLKRSGQAISQSSQRSGCAAEPFSSTRRRPRGGNREGFQKWQVTSEVTKGMQKHHFPHSTKTFVWNSFPLSVFRPNFLLRSKKNKTRFPSDECKNASQVTECQRHINVSNYVFDPSVVLLASKGPFSLCFVYGPVEP